MSKKKSLNFDLHEQVGTSNNRAYLFTSESVSEGHPDKLADKISDTILDRFLRGDPAAKVACECLVTDRLIVVAGEVDSTQNGLVDQVIAEIPRISRTVIREAGYDGSFPGINPEKCEILVRLNNQSADIHKGVELERGAIGAGDQGMMFGFACDETPELMPLPIMLAHKLVQRQAELRNTGVIPWLRPDAKSQVTVRYHGHTPIAVETVVLSTQHSDEVDIETVRSIVENEIIRPIIPADQQGDDLKILMNPTGRFVIGGPVGDCGLTGRKIVVDTYGGPCLANL